MLIIILFKQFSSPNKLSKVKTLKNCSIISLTEFKKLKKSLSILSEPNSPRLKKIRPLQSENLMKRIKSNSELPTKKFKKIYYSTESISNDKKIREKAKKYFEENLDEVKAINKLVLYAKMASIRDKQIEEQKKIKFDKKKLEEKMDLINEIERLKELRKYELKEEKRINMIKEEGNIIREQIKSNFLKKLKEKQEINKENIQNLILQKKYNKEQEKKIEDAKKIKQKLILYIAESNKKYIENKRLEKEKELEEEKKLIEFNKQKEKEEELELLNKKKLQKIKELELARIREKQKKSNDLKSHLDELRMKRSFESAEKISRIKEKEELIKKKIILDELINYNKQIVNVQRLKKMEQAVLDIQEFIKNINEIENEIKKDKIKNEEKKLKLKENNNILLQMIKEREDKRKINKREILEEGRIIKQNNERYYKRIEEIKKEKIKELEFLNINPEYLVPLKNFKTLNK